MEGALELLVQRGYLRKIVRIDVVDEKGKKKSGRKPSQMYQVNPYGLEPDDQEIEQEMSVLSDEELHEVAHEKA